MMQLLPLLLYARYLLTQEGFAWRLVYGKGGQESDVEPSGLFFEAGSEVIHILKTDPGLTLVPEVDPQVMVQKTQSENAHEYHHLKQGMYLWD